MDTLNDILDAVVAVMEAGMDADTIRDAIEVVIRETEERLADSE